MTKENVRILIFGVLRLSQMLAKGNAWHLSGYGTYFDEVHVGYLVGNDPAQVQKGAVRLVSLGSSSRILDALLAPWHLYRYARSCGGFDVYQTPDIVFSWWTALLLRLLLRAPVMLVPVSIPEQLYRDQKKSLSGLPIAIEKLMVRLSFRAAHRVVTGYSFGAFVDWLKSDPRSKAKLVVVRALPDALVSESFVRQSKNNLGSDASDRVFTLVSVSRLHHEKLLEDLVELMKLLKARGLGPDKVRLRLIGGGPLEATLRRQILGLEDQFELVGAVANEDLAAQLVEADLFVSTLTGSSLREAMCCGLPVVAYDRDWVQGLVIDGEHALLVPNRDVAALADAVERLIADAGLRVALGAAGRTLGLGLWTIQGCHAACQQIHEASQQPKAGHFKDTLNTRA